MHWRLSTAWLVLVALAAASSASAQPYCGLGTLKGAVGSNGTARLSLDANYQLHAEITYSGLSGAATSVGLFCCGKNELAVPLGDNSKPGLPLLSSLPSGGLDYVYDLRSGGAWNAYFLMTYYSNDPASADTALSTSLQSGGISVKINTASYANEMQGVVQSVACSPSPLAKPR